MRTIVKKDKNQFSWANDLLLVFALLINFSTHSNAQFDRQLWFIGDESANSGMIFENSAAQPFPTNLKGLIDLSENNIMLTSASIVKFYSNGETILNELNRPMPFGQKLEGSARSLKGSALVENPSACDQYYIFYTQSTDQGPNRKIFYSIIDMTILIEGVIFNSLGDVIPNQKDIDITPSGVDIGESIFALDKVIPKKGSWLLASDRNKNSIIIFNIDANGISIHREYQLSQVMSGFPSKTISTVTFESHPIDDTFSIVALAPSNESGITGFPIGSINFNHQTGEFDLNSFTEIANNTTFTYGTAFSQDGSKFYYSDHIDKTLHQYDFTSANTTLIATSNHNGKAGGLKRAINNEIYWANQYNILPEGTTVKTLSVIRQPNQPGLSCNQEFGAYAISTSGLPVRIGVFPSVISEFLNPKAIVVNEANCGLQDGNISVLVDPKLEPLNYSWNTGSTEKSLSNVGKGIYTVEMTSLDGCIFLDSVEIIELPGNQINNITLSFLDPSSCNLNDGEIIFKSPNLTMNTAFEIQYSDESGNEYLFELEANDNLELIVSNVSIGTYYNFSISQANDECRISLNDTIALTGMIGMPYLGNDTLLCEGVSYILEPDISYSSYLWSDGSNNPSITITETGIYSVQVSDDNDCTSSSSVYVQFVETPNITLEQVIELEVGDSAVLMPLISTPDSLLYEWSPPQGLSCTNCLSPLAKPLSNQEYLFEVFNESDCKDSASVLININNKIGLIFPNTFSPNGDGENDIFEYTISSEAVEMVKSFIIYNRWGEPTFRKENITLDQLNFGWDGIHGGKSAKNGIYIYSVEVELINGKIIRGHGDVLLIR